MGSTPNGLPYPESTGKLGAGDDDIKALALAVDPFLASVTPVAKGGTGANTAAGARDNLDVPWDNSGSVIRFWFPSFGRIAFEAPGNAFPTNIPLTSDIPAPGLPLTGGHITGDLFVEGGHLYVTNAVGATSGYTVAYINGDGRLSRGTSSRRFKDRIEDAPDLGELFPPLQQFVNRTDVDGNLHVGYVAEDFAEAPPLRRFVVWEVDDDGTRQPLAIDYIELLLAQVATLNARVRDLEGRAE